MTFPDEAVGWEMASAIRVARSKGNLIFIFNYYSKQINELKLIPTVQKNQNINKQ